MTDVESKTSNKRKSFQNKQTPKKQKLDTPQKNVFKKHTLTSNKKTTPHKFNKKLGATNVQKNIKPFAGTSVIEPSDEIISSENPKKNELKGDGNQVKRKRSTYCQGIRNQVHAGTITDDVIKSIEEKIKSFEDRSDLSKTAKRKLSFLKGLKKKTEGNTENQSQQRTQKVITTKSVVAKQEKLKNAGQQLNKGKKTMSVTKKDIKAGVISKNVEAKTNGSNAKNKQLVGKNNSQLKKENNKMLQQGEWDEDESDEDELDADEEESEENDSDEEGEEEADGDEQSGEEMESEDDDEEMSDEEDSDDESEQGEEPTVQVSTKRQKKK